MRFALVVVGDKNGHVGAGLGKLLRFRKQSAKVKRMLQKNLIKVALDKNDSITHDFIGKFGGASVLLRRLRKELELSPVVRHVP